MYNGKAPGVVDTGDSRVRVEAEASFPRGHLVFPLNALSAVYDFHRKTIGAVQHI